MGDGLKIAKTDLFDVSGRDEKHKVLFILTDGAAGDTFNEQAQALKDSAVSIYAVGMFSFIFEIKSSQKFQVNRLFLLYHS